MGWKKKTKTNQTKKRARFEGGVHHSAIPVSALLPFPSTFSVFYIFTAARREVSQGGCWSSPADRIQKLRSLPPAPTQNYIYHCEKRFSKTGKENKIIKNLSDATKQKEETEVDLALKLKWEIQVSKQICLSNLVNTLRLQVSYLLLKPATRLSNKFPCVPTEKKASAKKPTSTAKLKRQYSVQQAISYRASHRSI